MEKPSIKNTKRKLSMLSQQPPKLKPQTTHCERKLPRTPYPIVDGCTQYVSEQDGYAWAENPKKPRIAEDEGTLPRPLAISPSFDSRYLPTIQGHTIPPMELTKAWESILNQVDWSKMVQEVGGRETPGVYRNVFRTIVYSHIEGLLKQEEYGKDIKIEVRKRDDVNIDIESWNDSSEDSGGDASQNFEDHAFLESDESGCGSEDYMDDGTDHEEDSDDVSDDEEDSDDGDYEVINDLVSV